MKKLRLIVPVTFLTFGDPTVISTVGQTVKRAFRATLTFVDALELGIWLQSVFKGFRVGAVATTATAKPKAWKWNDGTRWNFAEWS